VPVFLILTGKLDELPIFTRLKFIEGGLISNTGICALRRTQKRIIKIKKVRFITSPTFIKYLS
jgi:hypothetical protein